MTGVDGAVLREQTAGSIQRRSYGINISGIDAGGGWHLDYVDTGICHFKRKSLKYPINANKFFNFEKIT